MPAPQLISAIVEDAINRILALDEQRALRLKPLAGKRLQVQLQELPFDLLFVLTSKIEVLTVERKTSGERENADKVNVDCLIGCSVFTLPELRQVSNITSLIKEEKLQLEGDIQLAQQFSQLFKSLDIDWEEQLSKHTGDIIAHQAGVIGKKLFGKLDKIITQTSTALGETAIEEKGIAAPKTLVEQFNDEVFDLQARVRKIEHRIAALGS